MVLNGIIEPSGDSALLQIKILSGGNAGLIGYVPTGWASERWPAPTRASKTR